MQLANNLSVLSSTLAGSLGYGGGGDPDELASPIIQEDEDDSGGEEPMLSGELIHGKKGRIRRSEQMPMDSMMARFNLR